MTATNENLTLIENTVRLVKDFPKPDILFRDVTPLFSDPKVLKIVLAELEKVAPKDIDVVAGVEARGFLLGVPLAVNLNLPFVPIRKEGKLPYKTYAQAYDLEYGTATLEIHQDACAKGSKVWLVDDLIATGGSMWAASELLKKIGATVVEATVLIELIGLHGWDKVPDIKGKSLLKLSES